MLAKGQRLLVHRERICEVLALQLRIGNVHVGLCAALRGRSDALVDPLRGVAVLNGVIELVLIVAHLREVTVDQATIQRRVAISRRHARQRRLELGARPVELALLPERETVVDL